MTRRASQQTYLTVRHLADRDRTADAYRAYAYFRWLDDELDSPTASAADRRRLLARQIALLDACLSGTKPQTSYAEELMLIELLRCGEGGDCGLMLYVRNLMKVMAFDQERRDRYVTQAELEAYQGWLAAGVTEALHYFIGHGRHTPKDATRYRAATGAHIVHMLRDTYEDVATGYYNVPLELLADHDITPADFEHRAYRAWVSGRVTQARRCFEDGRRYLSRVKCGRCRFAGYAYIDRFERVLEAIERDGYVLRSDYDGGSTIATVFHAIRDTMASGCSLRADSLSNGPSGPALN